MLRTIFVILLIGAGSFYSLRGPFYILLFYIWLAYFRPESWVWTDFLTGLNLSFIVGVALVITSVLSGARFHLRHRSALILLFALHCILSATFSAYNDVAWTYLKEFLKVLVISYLITVLVDNGQKFRLTVLVMCLSLGFEGAKQGWAQFVLNPGAANNNEIPFLGDNNGVALGMLMLVSLFSALAKTAAGKRERWVHQFFGVGVFYRGLTTYSRGAFLSVAAYAMFSAARSKHKLRTAIGLVLVAALMLPVMPQRFWDRMRTVQANEEGEHDESAAGRIYFWGLAARMGADNPLLGVGFNCFPYAYDRYDETNGAYGTRRAVHSTWFGTIADLGYLGLALFLLVLGSSFWACFRIERMKTDLPGIQALQPFATSIQGALLIIVVGGTFLHTQYTEMLWHIFGLSMALQRITADELAAEHAPPYAPEISVSPGAGPAFQRPPLPAAYGTPGIGTPQG